MEMNELDMNEMETKRDKSISHEVHSCDINYIALRLVVILTEWERYIQNAAAVLLLYYGYYSLRVIN